MSLARPRRLRSQLILAVAGVALLLAVLLGTASTLALRSSLLSQVDSSLELAAERGKQAPDFGAMSPGMLPDGVTLPEGAVPGVDASDASDADAGADDAAAQSDEDIGGGHGSDPVSLNVRGQAAGTVAVESVDGAVVSAGYLDSSGLPQELSDEQITALLAAGSDPTWVSIPDLGTYRAVSVDRGDGTVIVTALPWDDAAHTLTTYVIVEVVAGAVALGLAAALATVLVRRSLRPLDRVAQTAQRVSELPLDRGDPAIGERVPQQDTDERTEVGKVGASLNRMLGHVERSLAARHESETQVRKFVADASHELRTPLASIRGYSELVLRRGKATGELSEETEHAIGRVASEGKRMQALVEDLLLLARLDAGRELASGDVDLVAIAIDATSDAHAAGRGHTWALDVPDQGVPNVPGDDSRMRQVLANLLTNARVHTPEGTKITTAVRAFADPELGKSVRVTVTDDGPGIDPGLMPTLFRRFTRGDVARNRGSGEQASTGLGLAIVDAIVQAHGGRIGVESEPGQTRFTVVLPTEAPSEGASAAAEPRAETLAPSGEAVPATG